jgi:hypothetical protein
MPESRADALLTVARVVIVIVQVLIVVAMVGIGIALAAMVFAHGQVAAELTKQGVPSSAYWGIIVALLLGSGMLALWERFVVFLRRIVDSVGAGDPFAPENAVRLARMGWMALGVFALSIPLGILSAWIESVTEAGSLDIDFDGGGSGIVLALTLFILARVFRQGAAMREDLEGTV